VVSRELPQWIDRRSPDSTAGCAGRRKTLAVTAPTILDWQMRRRNGKAAEVQSFSLANVDYSIRLQQLQSRQMY
jgi:hypothetical protein